MAAIERTLEQTHTFTASEALKALRAALGETQQQFAHRVGMAITTIARYETSRPPRGSVLVTFANIAEENGLHEIATRFNNAIIREMGLVSSRAYMHALPRIERIHTLLNDIDKENFTPRQIEQICEAREKAFEAVQLLRPAKALFVREAAEWTED